MANDFLTMEIGNCPFCGGVMLARHRVNPVATCETEGCFLAEARIGIPLEDAAQMERFNRRASPLPPPGSAAEAEMVERAAEGVWIELATDFHWHEACVDPAHAEGVRWARKVAGAVLRAAFAKGGESAGEGRSG